MTAIVSTQAQITKELAQTIVAQRVSHSYLFVGANQIQTNELGLWFCQALFCQNSQAGYPCLQCDYCRRIAQHDFPDVVLVQSDKQSIGVDEIRSVKLEMGQTGVESAHRACVIMGAEKLTVAAENNLLKFLEEPAGAITTILLANSTNNFLSTILSRVQIIQLAAGQDEQLTQKLHSQGYSQPDIDLIHKAHLENLVAAEDAEHFTKLKTQAQSWFKLLITNPQQAFIAVAASILPVIENRIQQQIFLSLLEWYFSQYLQQQAQQSTWHQSRRLVEQFLHAQKLWQANVSFENSLEQLALIADSIIKGS